MIRTIRPARAIPSVEKRVRTFRYGRKWGNAAREFIARYPFCIVCLARGCVNKGAESRVADRNRMLVVDHIDPHHGDTQLIWDQDNWQTLCSTCHNGTKKMHELRGGDRQAWFSAIREMIDRNATREFVMSFAEWIPESSKQEIGLT